MKKRCAIYTRKSTDERLDMDFNTLDAQRESCEAYILSQKSEGWIASLDKYNDGGYSGGSLERPALSKLLDDIRAGKIQTVVVYKIDRLTRSLMDFSKLVEVFDEYGVTFVSVTQSFNTTTSMGRLTLNVLLSFAQFEREVAGERIRDKIAASKAKGMWMGGSPPVGYKIDNRRLVSNQKETKTARHIFDRYLALGNVRALKEELEQNDIKSPERISLKGRTMGGVKFSRGALYAILKNPAYIGKVSHKGKVYDGLHEGIIPLEIWERVQNRLKNQAVARTEATKKRHMLQGLLYDVDGVIYSPTFTKRHDKQYCYYISQNLVQNREHPHGVMARLPAHEIETLIERTMRNNIEKLCNETEGAILKHVLKYQENIPTYDLIRKCVNQITINFDELIIRVKPKPFKKLIEKHLNLSVTEYHKEFEITAPYKTGRSKRGAIVIESKNQNDIFDLPSPSLKKLVQGTIWRDEHFDGMALKDIAIRENFSQAYVGKTIFTSFEILQSL